VKSSASKLKHLALRPVRVGGSTTYDVLLGHSPTEKGGEVIPVASITRVFLGAGIPPAASCELGGAAFRQIVGLTTLLRAP
jgi:hypothetical protein